MVKKNENKDNKQTKKETPTKRVQRKVSDSSNDKTSSVNTQSVKVRHTKEELAAIKAEREAKKLERERLKREREAKKAAREAKKAEKEAKAKAKADAVALMERNKNLIKKIKVPGVIPVTKEEFSMLTKIFDSSEVKLNTIAYQTLGKHQFCILENKDNEHVIDVDSIMYYFNKDKEFACSFGPVCECQLTKANVPWGV